MESDHATIIQQNNGTQAALSAALRGFRRRCPRCGNPGLFAGFLKINDSCIHCGQELFHHRADDAPPYFTILIVGHFIIGGMLALETSMHPPYWVQMSIWMPLTVISSLLLLPPIKGALIAWQWALAMHGFGEQSSEKSDYGE